MDSILEWVEKAALENLRGHLASVDVITKEANTTLTILFAALGASFSYAVAVQTQPMKFAAIAMTVYLFALCMVLVAKCLMIEDAPPPTNEPRNLLQDGYTLDELVRTELTNIQKRIQQADIGDGDDASVWRGESRGACGKEKPGRHVRQSSRVREFGHPKGDEAGHWREVVPLVQAQR